jgi:hypothetical protein
VHDLGETKLKDIQHEHVYQVSVDGGPTAFPPLKADRPKSAGETLAERIEAHVERELERAFTGESIATAPARAAAAGMTALAITVLALVATAIGVVLLVKLVL